MKYYGIDWAIFVLLVCHLWFLGERTRFAFLFGAAAAVCGVFFGHLIDSIAMIAMNVVFCGMHLMAYAKWNKDG
jgi:hypothetical protein